MRAITFLLNRYRHERVPMLLLALLVLVTAFLSALAPRLFNRVADDGLRHVVAQATPIERNVQLGQIGKVPRGADEGQLAPIRAVGAELEAELPDTVRTLIADRSFLVDSANWSVIDPPVEEVSFVTFRFQDGVEDHIDYVDGRAPTGETGTAPGARGTLPGETQDATVFEIAFSTETARELAVEVGDRLDLVPDVNDPLVGRISSPERATVDVVGIFEVLDPDAEYWMNDASIDVPTIIPITPDDWLVYATGLLAPEAYPTLINKDLPARYAWRYYVDAARLDAGMLPSLSADLSQMAARYPAFVSSQRDADVTTLQTALLALTHAFDAERRTTEAVLVTAAVGPIAVATASVVLVALLLVHRRRGAVALVRGRGASVAQIIGTHLVEGLVLALPAAAAAYLGALAAVDARGSAWSPFAAGMVAAGATLVLVLTVVGPATAPLHALQRESPTAVRVSPRRLVFEALALIMAVGGTVLLRQRGIVGGGVAGELAGVDPLLAAVPALIGLAVGLVTIRLYPFPLRAAGWFIDGWRGMVPALGLRRAARTGDAGSLPLIVLLVTVAIGAFSSAMFVTIERGQIATSWQEVGADVAIDAGSFRFPLDFDSTTLRGVEAAAEMHVETASLGGRGGARTTMYALDLEAYDAVSDGTPADARVPNAMLEMPATDEPIPIILSEAAAGRAANPIRVGDEIDLLVSARGATFRVVDIRDSFPAVAPTTPWVVVPLDALRAAIPGRAFGASVMLLRAPGADPEDLRDSVAAVAPSAHLTAQGERLADLRSSPLVRAVGAGFVLAVVVAMAYAALATTVALVLIAAVRVRETAHLRTLGLSRRAIVELAIVEHGPAVLVAIAVGIGLGIGIAWFVAPGLGLAALVGSGTSVALEVDWRVATLLLAALIIVLAIGIGLSTWIGRRADLAGSTRQGIE
jgi:putative ABC transport system permease protein